MNERVWEIKNSSMLRPGSALIPQMYVFISRFHKTHLISMKFGTLIDLGLMVSLNE